jgi:hypothetical protein
MSGVTWTSFSAATAKVPGRQSAADTTSLNKVEFMVVVPVVVDESGAQIS